MPELRAKLTLALGAAYMLERELAGNGTSRLFVAREESLDSDVVVKVLGRSLTRGVSAERFEAVMLRARALNESHTLPVLTTGQLEDGAHYYTMPYVPGHSLRHRIEQGPVGFDESVSILRDIARAMAYAHGKGFVHRDLKPENVVIAKDTAVVVDFGLVDALRLARSPETRDTPTHGIPRLGTLAYMSPEQAAGDPNTDHRTDLYAWGVLAYELLFDADPFENAPAEPLTDPLSSEFPFLMLYKRHGVPEQLATLVKRCLEKDPAARPDSAEELVTVLERIPDARLVLEMETKNAARWVGASMMIALALFVAGAVAVWRMQTREVTRVPLVAVLPPINTGAVSDTLYGEALADAVSLKLAKLADLRVIDRRSVLSVINGDRYPRNTGRVLGADYVLRPSLHWTRDPDGEPQVRLTSTLIRMSDSMTTWVGRPQALSPSDLSIPGTVALEVAEALAAVGGRRDRAVLTAVPTRDTAAYFAFTRGNRLYRDLPPHAVLEYEPALREFERAYRLDPTFADAYGAASTVLLCLAHVRADSVLLDSAAVMAHRTLTRAPEQVRALTTAATVAMLADRRSDADLLASKAVSTTPSNIEALQLHAELQLLAGDSAAAWRDLEQLTALAPRNADALVFAATGAQSMRRFSDASRFLQRARALEPERLDLVLRVGVLDRPQGVFEASLQPGASFGREAPIPPRWIASCAAPRARAH